jgi:hypothetical protein
MPWWDGTEGRRGWFLRSRKLCRRFGEDADWGVRWEAAGGSCWGELCHVFCPTITTTEHSVNENRNYGYS